jgi:hypothetical protein
VRFGMRHAVCASLAILTAVGARAASAAPQASGGVTVGGAADDVGSASTRSFDLHLGGRFDVLFGRSSNRDMALGPYLDVATAAFRTSDFGGGLEWLVPAVPELPLTLSAGGFARNGGGRSWAPGVEGTAMLGARSYNYHSWYGLAAGLFVQTRWVPEPPASVDLIAGVQIDLELLVLPFLLLWNAATHGG